MWDETHVGSFFSARTHSTQVHIYAPNTHSRYISTSSLFSFQERKDNYILKVDNYW